MKNPVLTRFGYKIYVLVWIFILLAHSLLMHIYFGFSLLISFSDAIIYSGFFGIIAPGFWYIVNFTGQARDGLSIAGTLLGAGVVSVFFWASISPIPLMAYYEEEDFYISFINHSYVWRLVIGLLYYSIVVLVFFLIKYYTNLRDRMKRELELEHLLKDSELRMLKSQINPHFIFNSLNSISALTISKPELAQEMVIKLSGFLRHSLGKDSVELNSLKEELNNTKLYLDIEKVRFGDRLKVKIDVPIECQLIKVPNLILQPLVENAIKYGLYESMELVTIVISGYLQGDFMVLCISNNFDGAAVFSKGAGIGLKNVKRRLQLVYGRSDLMEISKMDNVYTALIKIPTGYE